MRRLIRFVSKPVPLVSMVTAIIGAAFVGTSGIFVRLTTTGPFVTGFYRFLFALPFIFGWYIFEQRRGEKEASRKFRFKDWILVGVTGLAFALDVALWNYSLDHTTVVNSSVFNNFTAFFVPLYVWVLFSERPGIHFLFAGIFGLFGSFLLAGGGLEMKCETLKGDLLAILASTTYSVYIVGVKQLRNRFASSSIMMALAIVSAVSIGLLALVRGESFYPISPRDILFLFGMALFVHVLGQGLLAKAMGQVSASFSAVVMFIGPLVSGALAWMLFQEVMKPLQIIGAAIVLGSIVFLQVSEAQKPSPPFWRFWEW